jgi:Spy/CpxP family protein refolding chaperone
MKLTSWLLATVFMMGLSGTVLAQHEGGNCDKLNLTAEQKTQIEKLKTAHMKEMIGLKNQLQEKKAHLHTVSTVDKVDMVEVNKTIDEIGALKTEMMKKKEAHKQEVRKLLTEEQRLKFDMQHGCCGGDDDHGKGCGKGMKGNAGCGDMKGNAGCGDMKGNAGCGDKQGKANCGGGQGMQGKGGKCQGGGE